MIHSHFCFAIGFAALLSATPCSAATTFTPLDFPGLPQGATMRAYGISGNTVVGWYGPAGGFSYNSGIYTPTNVFKPVGIDGTTMVGGTFVNSAGVLTNLGPYPGSITTFASGVSGGTVVGWYKDAADVSHGFIHTAGGYVPLNHPLATDAGGGTVAWGIDGNNIVGTYFDATDAHGFVWNGTAFTTLNNPAAIPGKTFAWGISGNTVVGDYYDGTRYHGFIETNGAYTQLDYPSAATFTYIFGISGNTVVGYYDDANGNEHGFMATFDPVPEPTSLLMFGATSVLVLCQKQRGRTG
jgi:hypothetical protein